MLRLILIEAVRRRFHLRLSTVNPNPKILNNNHNNNNNNNNRNATDLIANAPLP